MKRAVVITGLSLGAVMLAGCGGGGSASSSTASVPTAVSIPTTAAISPARAAFSEELSTLMVQLNEGGALELCADQESFVARLVDAAVANPAYASLSKEEMADVGRKQAATFCASK